MNKVKSVCNRKSIRHFARTFDNNSQLIDGFDKNAYLYLLSACVLLRTFFFSKVIDNYKCSLKVFTYLEISL